MSEYADAFFIIGSITVLFAVGYGAVMLLGLMIVKVWDRSRRKHRWTVVRRAL